MAKIHRSDAPLPQAPSVQVKASYTVTDLPKVSPQEPAAFYDQDNDEDYRRRETAKCKKKRGNLLYTLAMIVFAAIFLISGGLLVKRFLDDRKTESEFADLQSMIDTAATPAPAGENVNPNGARFAALRDMISSSRFCAPLPVTITTAGNLVPFSGRVNVPARLIPSRSFLTVTSSLL